MKDFVTQSEIQTFADCRIKHQLSYNQLLKLKTQNIALHLGTVMHTWLEGYYLGKPKGTLKEIHQQAIIDGAEMNEKSEQETLSTLNALSAIIQVYPEVDPVKRFKLEVLAVEKVFEVQDPNVPMRALTGKIDVIAKDKSGRIWIIDHKTVSRIEQDFIDKFPLDRQVQDYLLALRGDKSISCHGRPGGMIPNLIRKPQLRLKEGESEEVFLRRVREDIHARRAEYFFSDMMAYDEKVNGRWEKSEWPLIREMRNPKRLLYPNSSQCITIYGRCPFHAICCETPGYESLYTNKKARHEELLKPVKALGVPSPKTQTDAEPSKRAEPPVAEQAGNSKKVLEGLVALVNKTQARK